MASMTTAPALNLLDDFEPPLQEPQNLIVEGAPVLDGERRELLVDGLGQAKTELDDFPLLGLPRFSHEKSLAFEMVLCQSQDGIDLLAPQCYTITVPSYNLSDFVASPDSHGSETRTSPTPTQSDFSALIFSMTSAKGRQRYTLEVEDGTLTRLEVTSCNPADLTVPLDDDYVSMAKAAAILRHAASWLSRRQNGEPLWKHLGLIPRRIGRRLLFRKSDLYKLMDSRALRRRGRPRRALNLHVNA